VSIADIIKTVQDDCSRARKQMEAVRDLLDSVRPPAPDEWERLIASIAEAQSQLARMLDEKRALLGQLEETSPAGADIDHTLDPAGQFSLKGLFQALYEFCTNEDYKKKIKIMWERHEELFDTDALHEGMTEGADDLTADDGLYPFSISFLLSRLEDCCTVPNVKNFITALAAEAESAFVEPTIPLEKLPTTDGASHGEEGVPSPSEKVSLVDLLRADVELMEALLTQWERPADRDEPNPEAQGGASTPLHESLEQAKGAIEEIDNSLSGIIEAFASEAFSSERLLKMAHVLESVQLDLLRVILAYNTMTKNLGEQPEVSPTKQMQLAEDEVGRMLVDLRLPGEEASAGGGERLDQDKIQELLRSLGF